MAGPAFNLMFPDSKIAQKFSLGETKLSYLITFAIAPYYQDNLFEKLQSSKHYVVCFDEALNKVAQKGQMNMHVIFYDEGKDQVVTRYLNSVFLGLSNYID